MAVLTVELKGRVRRIGVNTFSQFTNLREVHFGGTQKHIGMRLKLVKIPNF